MKQLWAPWRIEYIRSVDKPQGGCIFCGATKGVGRPSLVLYSGALTTVMMNRYPYSNGHLLVSPARHTSSLDTLTTEESTDIMRVLARSASILTDVMRAEGINTGANLGRAAGAGIADHLHFHVVPRWNGDANFMAVISEVRVIPEHIEATFDLLQPHFSGL